LKPREKNRQSIMAEEKPGHDETHGVGHGESDLEKKVGDKESKGFIRKAFDTAFNVGMAAATTALSMATVGPVGPIVGGAFGAGIAIGSFIKGGFYKGFDAALKAYSAINAVIYPIISLGNVTFPLIPNGTWVGKIARTLYATTAYNAAFVGSFRAAHHLIDNKFNPTGLGSAISKNFWAQSKRVGLGFLPGYALVANGVHSLWGISPFAWNALPFGIYETLAPLGAKKEKKEERAKAPGSHYSPFQIPQYGYR